MSKTLSFFLCLFKWASLICQGNVDSKYAYSLPYEKEKSYLVVQGYNSKMSHKNEFALDFKMKRGTKICAARSGVVTELKEDSGKGGLKTKFIQDGNYVIIRHNDGSFAWYWHLKKNGVVVKIGDEVLEGEVIGLSGRSGYSAFPHLHFEVVVVDSLTETRQIRTLFKTRKGIKYLKVGGFYRNKG